MTGWAKRKDEPPRLRGHANIRRRERIALRDLYTCQACKRITDLPDGEADHVVPLSMGGKDEEANLQWLCRRCHSFKSATENTGRARHLPEWLPKPLIPVVAVCGPPAAGKSTYVAERASKRDLVLDADDIACRITGKPIYTHSKDEIEAAIRYRNTELGRIGRNPQHERCWLVVTASTLNGRSFWREYATDLVVLDPGISECVRRIEADARRPEAAKRRHTEAARAWERGSIPKWKARPSKGCDVNGYPEGWR